jgi:hypothetical protein
MKRRFSFFPFLTVFLLFPNFLEAQDSSAAKIEFTGMAAMVQGQYVNCNYYYTGEMPFRPWVSNEYARLGIKASINDHYRFIVIPQIKLWNDTWNWAKMGPKGDGANNPFIQHTTVSLYDAEGIFSFGNKNTLAYTVSAGVFPYKYDADSKNLGEYLFRTGEHPAYIQNAFDQAYAEMTGARANAELFNRFSADIFFTTETQVMPLNDWSLSFLLDYKLPGFLDVGAGIMFDRLFWVEKQLDKNDGGIGAPNTFLNSSGHLDTLSWGGTKLMGKATLDPKGFLPSSAVKLFGKEDGKIYGEVAVLGLKSFTAYKHPNDTATGLTDLTKLVPDSSMNFYSDIRQRIPVMFGFNVPTFRLLDYLSVELEWFGWPYKPYIFTYENFKWALPKPDPGSSALFETDDNWKYSFNFRKTIWGNLSVIGQIARDHTRHDIYFNGNFDPEEIFQSKDQWGWWLKLQYNF